MSSSSTRIFIVDDHPLVRELLGNLLRMEPDFVVVGQAEDSNSALQLMAAAAPDIAVVDLTLKKGSGLELIKALRVQVPSVGIVVLSMHEELMDIERAFRAGAAAYVMKHESTSQIVTAIREVRAGRVYANPATLAQLTSRLMGRPLGSIAGLTDPLSDRELEVFRRLGNGQSTREISEALGVSLKTVQTYCARIKEKLGFDDGQELVRAAFRWHEQAHPRGG